MAIIGTILENSGIPGGGAIGSLAESYLGTINYDADQFREQFPNPDFQALQYWKFCNLHAPNKVSGQESVWNSPNSIWDFRNKWAQNFDRMRSMGYAPTGTSQQGEFDAISLGSWDANMNWVPPQEEVVNGNGDVIGGQGTNKDLKAGYPWPWLAGSWSGYDTKTKAAWIALGSGILAGLVWVGTRIFRKKKKRNYYKPR